MTRTRALVVAMVVATLVAACGGGGSNGGSNGNTGGGGTTPANPCTTPLLADTGEIAAIGSVARTGGPVVDKKILIDGDPRGRVDEALALHRDAVARREGRARAAL